MLNILDVFSDRDNSFERWFDKYVREKMSEIIENKKDLDTCLIVAKSLDRKIGSFKCIYGIAERVLSQNGLIIRLLRKLVI